MAGRYNGGNRYTGGGGVGDPVIGILEFSTVVATAQRTTVEVIRLSTMGLLMLGRTKSMPVP